MLVPNVVRSADDFVAGAADMFYFAFGAPKVREVDATVGGIRVLEIPDERAWRRRARSCPGATCRRSAPGPIFIGVEKPMKVYSFDNVLITNAKVTDELVYKIIDTMEKNKDDLVAVQPVLREFTAAVGYKQYGVPYHPGALKYFKDNKIDAHDDPLTTQIFHRTWGKPCPSNRFRHPDRQHRARRALVRGRQPRPRRPTVLPPCSPARSPTRPRPPSPRC